MNVSGIRARCPDELDLQSNADFAARAERAGEWIRRRLRGSRSAALCGAVHGRASLLILMAELAPKCPGGWTMRAIRDNETPAEAMGKNVTRRHLQIFVIGSAGLV